MTIRIPADKFQESLAEIRKTVDRVVVETVSGQDVTEEFVDIEARLKTKKALEERFLEIMKQAKSVNDALNVERQLAEVRTEIERIEGRKRFLENQTSLSTITLELQTPAAISGSSSGFFYELREALSDGFSAALTFILVLVRIFIALIPFLLLVVLPIFLLLRYFWRRSKKREKRETTESIVREEIDVE
jgi:Flp pilus assembly protein TadB